MLRLIGKHDRIRTAPAAIDALVYKTADYTKVDEAIAKAEALNKADYKDFSAVEKAIEAVKRDLDITKQEEVDAMAKAIEDAIAGHRRKKHLLQAEQQMGQQTVEIQQMVHLIQSKQVTQQI